jgi:hypothetical protein
LWKLAFIPVAFNLPEKNKMSCQLPKVEKFLCCLELETGGLIIGWVSAIVSGIGSIVSALLLIGVAITYDKQNEETNGVFIGKNL